MHTAKQRSLVGSWHTEELYLAQEHGYVIEDIYQVWNYKDTYQYDPKKEKIGQLFTGNFYL